MLAPIPGLFDILALQAPGRRAPGDVKMTTIRYTTVSDCNSDWVPRRLASIATLRAERHPEVHGGRGRCSRS